MKPTDVDQFIDALNAGVFKQLLAAALSQVAGACADGEQKSKGSVKITLQLEKQAEGALSVHETITSEYPTLSGRDTRTANKSEKTVYFLTADGLVPSNQFQPELNLSAQQEGLDR